MLDSALSLAAFGLQKIRCQRTGFVVPLVVVLVHFVLLCRNVLALGVEAEGSTIKCLHLVRSKFTVS